MSLRQGTEKNLGFPVFFLCLLFGGKFGILSCEVIPHEASDLHGSARFCRQLLERYQQEGAQQLILLGDLVYSGSYAPQYEYDPHQVIQLLRPLAREILWVEGNCDRGAGALGPAFPMYAGSATVSWEGLSVFLTHGHRYGPHNPPPIGAAQVLLSGHTHIPSWQWVGDLFCANPGSVSLPRGGSPHSCLLYEDGLFRWLTLEGETFHWEVLPPPSKENILSD